ncbi:MAG: hypothetical protein ACRDYV_13765, partial [Acidimicrobiia bacterium]
MDPARGLPPAARWRQGSPPGSLELGDVGERIGDHHHPPWHAAGQRFELTGQIRPDGDARSLRGQDEVEHDGLGSRTGRQGPAEVGADLVGVDGDPGGVVQGLQHALHVGGAHLGLDDVEHVAAVNRQEVDESRSPGAAPGRILPPEVGDVEPGQARRRQGRLHPVLDMTRVVAGEPLPHRVGHPAFDLRQLHRRELPGQGKNERLLLAGRGLPIGHAGQD